MTAAEIEHGSFDTNWTGTGRRAVIATLDKARALGVTFIRTWAFSIADGSPLLVSPGLYDERLLRALDFVIGEAGKRNIRLSLVLADWWKATGGVRQFTGFVGSSKPTDFYTDEQVIRIYKTHILTLLRRVNSLTGLRYTADPHIFGWELLVRSRNRSRLCFN